MQPTGKDLIRELFLWTDWRATASSKIRQETEYFNITIRDVCRGTGWRNQ